MPITWVCLRIPEPYYRPWPWPSKSSPKKQTNLWNRKSMPPPNPTDIYWSTWNRVLPTNWDWEATFSHRKIKMCFRRGKVNKDEKECVVHLQWTKECANCKLITGGINRSQVPKRPQWKPVGGEKKSRPENRCYAQLNYTNIIKLHKKIKQW